MGACRPVGYVPRHTATSDLRRILAEHLPAFLERVEHDGAGLPRFVTAELEGLLRCAEFEHGFLRLAVPGAATSCASRRSRSPSRQAAIVAVSALATERGSLGYGVVGTGRIRGARGFERLMCPRAEAQLRLEPLTDDASEASLRLPSLTDDPSRAQPRLRPLTDDPPEA
jgi:hypothetical protein